jgi:predicted adenylyl cyclase CyaB
LVQNEKRLPKCRAYRESDRMARNIEVKARISSVEALAPKVGLIADQGPFAIAQDDTYFTCPAGRLKVRTFSSDHGELIFYRRSDQRAAKESFYLRSRTSSPETLRRSLSLAYGQLGRVEKQRTLFLLGRTRIHLDKVTGLGHFLELEVVLEEDEPPEAGVREANELLARLGVNPSQLIEGGYLDLLGKSADGQTVPRDSRA